MQKKFIILVALLVVIISQIIPAGALVIYYDDTKSGESSMARGIAKAFNANSSHQAELITFSEEKTDGRFSSRLTENSDTLLLIELGTFPFLEKEAATVKDAGWKLGHVTHQIFEGHKDVAPLLDVLFLPGYLEGTSLQEAVLPDTSNINWLNGVPYDIDASVVKNAYEGVAAELPQADEYVVLYLGGDAPDETGTQRLYIPEEAIRLADHINQTDPEAHIIVVNGPRTGKHTENLDTIEGIHRGETPTDAVTQAVDIALGDHPHTVYDFRYGGNSMYKPLLGMLSLGNGKIYVPGESNSVISDIVALGLQSQAVVFTHGAMNNLHFANVAHAHRYQGLSYIDSKDELKLHRAVSSTEEQLNPNEQVVQGLL